MTPRVVSAAFSAVLYVALLAGSFIPEIRQVQVKAFGPEPLGLPNIFFVILLETVLYLPFALRVFPHTNRLLMQARKDGIRLTPRRIIFYAWDAPSYHPKLVESQLWFFGGLLYFLGLSATWMAYAVWHGL